MKEGKYQIYILEDDYGIGEFLQFLLESEGYNVFVFPTVTKFYTRIRNYTPDLALLDIRLPDGHGRDVCRKLRQRNETLSVPIILMSANVVPRAEIGANDFIPKPFDIDDLIQRVRRQLNT